MPRRVRELSEFLRGTPARRWRLERRRGEGGPWEEVAPAGGHAALGDEVGAPRFAWSVGDLVAGRAPGGRLRNLWVGTPEGFAHVEAVPAALGDHGIDWVTAWEGPEAHAERMLRVATDVDPRRLGLAVPVDARRLVRAAAACAGAVVRDLVPDEQDAARADVAFVRAWTGLGADWFPAPLDRLRALGTRIEARAAYGARDVGRRTPQGRAQEALLEMLRAAAAPDDAELGRRVRAVGLACAFIEGAGGQCAPLVRAHVPLSVVLLAIEGAPTAPDLLGF